MNTFNYIHGLDFLMQSMSITWDVISDVNQSVLVSHLGHCQSTMQLTPCQHLHMFSSYQMLNKQVPAQSAQKPPPHHQHTHTHIT